MLRWCCGGVAVVLRWCCSGVAVVLPWCCGGVAVLWCCGGVSIYHRSFTASEHERPRARLAGTRD